jgi:predicted acyltransferase
VRAKVCGEEFGVTATAADPRLATARRTKRLLSLDVLRGVAVAGMLLVNNPGVRAATPAPLRHSEWSGLSPADAIFPLFLFAVGMSIPLSRRAAEPRLALRRVALLYLLGVALVTLKYRYLGIGGGVLQHIAGAYLLAWLALRLPRRRQPMAALGLLATGWAAMTFAPGGYRLLAGEGPAVDLTSAASILGGTFVARSILGRSVPTVLRRLLAWSAASVVVGLVLAISIPVVKHLWTPSYALISHGIACAVLLAIHWVVHARGRRQWIRPFLDMGANPIAVYVVMSAFAVVVLAPVRSSLVSPVSAALGDPAASVLYATSVAVLGWALAAWLRRRGVYLRV